MKLWLRLYPRAWRERYGDELEALLEEEPRSFRLWLDLVAGAVDARLNPQWAPAAPTDRGARTMLSYLKCCERSSFPVRAQLWSAALMIGVSLLLVSVHLGLVAADGETPWNQALLYSAFNIALVLSSIPTFLSAYRPRVRWTLVGLGVAASYAFFLGVTLLADRI